MEHAYRSLYLLTGMNDVDIVHIKIVLKPHYNHRKHLKTLILGTSTLTYTIDITLAHSKKVSYSEVPVYQSVFQDLITYNNYYTNEHT